MREQVVAAILDEAVIIVVVAAVVLLLVYSGVPFHLLLPVLVVIGFLALALVKGVYAQLERPRAGPEALIGARGVVKDELAEEGLYLVLVEGELWKALCRGCRLRRGERVCIVDVQGLILVVEPCG